MVSNLLLSLSSLLWGIHNQGEPQRITIDHFTSGYVQGIKGEDIHLPALEVSEAPTIIVAVLDTGIDATHPDLRDRLAGKGFNFTTNTEDTTDTHGHGTHIAGIIAAQVSKNARILPVKVVQTGPNAPIRPQGIEPGSGTALTENVAKGIRYAIEQGARVINLSLAWPATIRSKAVDAAMKLAEERDILVVASAANDNTTANLYPCIYPNVICVGAHGPDGSMTYFSNHGSMVDLLAPGIAILSTWPVNKAPITFAGQVGYEFRNGTSMAAPFVAGSLAELLARGFSPKESKNRILLGSRPVRTETLYSTAVVGSYSADLRNENRITRFGNLDVSNALTLSPRSLILPTEKARIELEWNGVDPFIPALIHWKNFWKPASQVEISILGKTHHFNLLSENQVVATELLFPIDFSTESTLHLTALITAIEPDGSRSQRTVPLSFSISRMITPDFTRTIQDRYPIAGCIPEPGSSIRSVVGNVSPDLHELLFIGPTRLLLTRNGSCTGTLERSIPALKTVSENQILNLYRLANHELALIVMNPASGDSRAGFRILQLDGTLKLINEVQLGTETTVLNERLTWIKTRTTYSPLWISIGFTPASQKPKKDPWNPDQKDIKMPRIYFLEQGELKTVLLNDDEIPLQILPDGTILVVQGTSYFARYELLSLDLTSNPHSVHRKPVTMNEFRMLIGLDASNRVLSLNGSTPDSLAFIGLSTPGNLRASFLGSSAILENHDLILKRSSTLESLVQVTGAFKDSSQSYFFAQTHYDLKFFRSGSNQTHSVSLNRYSYVPSMIFSKSFFPTLVRDSCGLGYPALYIPASLMNGNISEVIVGDPKSGDISKPARLRLQAQSGCVALGNLIPSTETSPSKQAFYCQPNQEVLFIPLTSVK